MIKAENFRQIMSPPWQIVALDIIDGVAEYNISKITKSASKTKPSISDPSSFQNPTQMTKVAWCHQIMPLPWQIVTTEGLGPVQAINIILNKPHHTDSSSHDFEKVDEGLKVD